MSTRAARSTTAETQVLAAAPREGAVCCREAQEAPGLAFPLAAAPAEATPDSTSAVLRHSQAQITRKPPHRASHRADEVENVFLISCRDQLAKQAILLACISPHSLRLGRVVPVLPVGPARPLQFLWRARSGARSTVQSRFITQPIAVMLPPSGWGPHRDLSGLRQPLGITPAPATQPISGRL